MVFSLLFVEDGDPQLRGLLDEVLGSESCVEHVHTGREAVAALARGGFDAVVVAGRLADSSPAGLIRQLSRSGVPLVVVADGIGGASDLDALKAGACDVLERPSLTRPQLERSLLYAVERQKPAQRLHAAQLACARVLAEGRPLRETVPRLLAAFGGALGWDAGLYWTIDPRAGRLIRSESWQRPEAPFASLLSHSPTFSRGQALPGRAWAEMRPIWSTDLRSLDDPRAEAAQQEGVGTAYAFPVRTTADEHIGVLELFSRRHNDADAALDETALDLGQRLAELARREQAEDARRESEERYALAVRGANDGIWDWDIRSGRLYVSERFKAILGFADDEAVANTIVDWFQRIHPEDLPRVRMKLGEHLAGHAPSFEDEHRIRRKDRSYRWVHTRGFAVRDAMGRVYRMAGAQTDVTDRRTYDALTGLPNRALFAERLDQALQRSVRRRGYLFAVLFLDLDGFKDVNDSLGHVAGDQLLFAIAKRLESCVRPGDLVARFGGDEFALLLDRTAGAADATWVAERILEELRTPFAIAGQEIFSSASIGVALSSTGYTRSQDMLRDADTALYRAKATGKSRFEVFDERMRERMLVRLALESALRRARERAEFELYYQPIVSLRTGALEGFEALLRWRHPERGLLLPDDFLREAERTGLIVPIGEWALREAVRQARAWSDAQPALRLTLSVNVSARQLAARTLVGSFQAALADSGLAADRLCVEVTENVFFGGSEDVALVLTELKRLGLHVHVDDFGTGYSPLGILHRFPVDALKIDRSFVAGLGRQRPCAAIVRAIVSLAQSLDMAVIAEGIEQEEQLHALESMGCDAGQGFLLGEPVDSVGAAAVVKRAVVTPDLSRR